MKVPIWAEKRNDMNMLFVLHLSGHLNEKNGVKMLKMVQVADRIAACAFLNGSVWAREDIGLHSLDKKKIIGTNEDVVPPIQSLCARENR